MKNRVMEIIVNSVSPLSRWREYMTRLSIEDGRFNNELFERLVQRLMFITWQFDITNAFSDIINKICDWK